MGRVYIAAMGLLLAGLTVLSPAVALATTGSTSVSPTSTGSWAGLTTSPQDVFVSSDNTVYVVDESNKTVQMFVADPANTHPTITTWTNFNYPVAVSADNQGNVYVAQYGDHSIVKFPNTAAAGNVTPTATWMMPGGILSVAVDGAGNVYSGTYVDQTVYRFSSSAPSGVVTPATTWTNTGVESFVLGDDGSVYGIGYMSSGVFSFSTSAPAGSVSSVLKSWYGPSGMSMLGSIGESGGVIYVQSGETVESFPANAAVGTTPIGTAITSFGEGVSVMYVKSDGTLFAAKSNGGVMRVGYPHNTAVETIPGTANKLNLTLPIGSDITSESVAPSSTTDTGYTYPLGLFNFTFGLLGGAIGGNVPVELTFQTDLQPSQVVPRKFSATTQQYTDIPGATVTTTTVDGKAALKVAYTVTDGGALDEDGVANGKITDPVGLAVVDTQGMLANTGAPVQMYGSAVAILFLTASALFVAGKRQ